MRTKYLLTILSVALLLSSCANIKEFNYFQDTAAGVVNSLKTDNSTITFKPNDRITVLVSSKDLELAMPFNLITINNVQYRSSQLGQNALNANNYTQYYTISEDGEIHMPVLGKVKVAGLTRTQAEDTISNLIMSSENGFKDPTVTIDYANLSVKMLGELKNPGTVIIDRDQFTILDAIAKAGDLTVYGNRKNIKVFRLENDEEKVYVVDLTQRQQLLQSPVYFLQQNDVIYVESNKARVRQSTTSENAWLQPAFWVSVISLLSTITALIIK